MRASAPAAPRCLLLARGAREARARARPAAACRAHALAARALGRALHAQAEASALRLAACRRAARARRLPRECAAAVQAQTAAQDRRACSQATVRALRARLKPPRAVGCRNEAPQVLNALVETAMLAACTGLAYHLSSAFRLEAYLGAFFPLPTVLAAARWRGGVAVKTTARGGAQAAPPAQSCADAAVALLHFLHRLRRRCCCCCLEGPCALARTFCCMVRRALRPALLARWHDVIARVQARSGSPSACCGGPDCRGSSPSRALRWCARKASRVLCVCDFGCRRCGRLACLRHSS